jgi:hypothetical protein
MRKMTRIAAMVSLFSAFCFAETWTGKLVDANCHAQNEKKPAPAACSPTATTSSFGIETADGKFYQLDSSGNGKAAAAIKADASKDSVTVMGTIEGKTLKVESLVVQQ